MSGGAIVGGDGIGALEVCVCTDSLLGDVNFVGVGAGTMLECVGLSCGESRGRMTATSSVTMRSGIYRSSEASNLKDSNERPSLTSCFMSGLRMDRRAFSDQWLLLGARGCVWVHV